MNTTGIGLWEPKNKYTWRRPVILLFWRTTSSRIYLAHYVCFTFQNTQKCIWYALPPISNLPPPSLSPLLFFQWTFGKLGQMEHAPCLYNCYNSSNCRRIQVITYLISLPFNDQHEKQPHFLFIFHDSEGPTEEAHLPLFSAFLLCITASPCTCWLFAKIEDGVTLCLILGISQVEPKSKFWKLYQEKAVKNLCLL